MKNEFRVWDKKRKSMHTVISLHHPKYLDCCEYATGQSSDSVVSVQYKDCEIMQSTGLLDNNEKEIFEGDILKVYDKFSKKIHFGNVQLIDGCWSIKFNKRMKWSYEDYYRDFDYLKMITGTFTSCEVVGNIYQNSRKYAKR